MNYVNIRSFLRDAYEIFYEAKRLLVGQSNARKRNWLFLSISDWFYFAAVLQKLDGSGRRVRRITTLSSTK